MVYPNHQGMSVAPDSPSNLPGFRRPPAFGGTGKDPVWEISEGDLGPNLNFNQNSPGHGVIEPSRPMTYEEYSNSLYDLKELLQKTTS